MRLLNRHDLLMLVNPGAFEFPPRGYGGGERFTLQVARAMGRLMKVTVIDFGAEAKSLEAGGVPVVRVRTRLRLRANMKFSHYTWNAVVTSWSLFHEVLARRWKQEPRFIYFHNSVQFSIFRRMQKAFMPRLDLTYIFRLQSPNWMNYQMVPWWKRVLAVPTELYATRSADVVLFESDVVRQSIERHWKVSRNSLVVPNTVDLDYFSRPRWGRVMYPFGVFYGARIKRQKNQLAVVRAFREVVDHEPRAVLLLMGDAEEKDYLMEVKNEVIKLKLPSRVTFKPSGTIEELNRERAKYPIHIVYSNYTGFDVAVGETMSMGGATIFSDIPTLRGIAKHEFNCLLVPPNDPERLAQSILKLLTNSDFAESLGQKARETASEQLSFGRYLVDFISSLENTVASQTTNARA